jgi:hypothetical protein
MVERKFEQAGQVRRSKVMRECRQLLREQTTKSGRWGKIKPVVDAVRLGEREDIVMVRQLGEKITEFAVVTYRERLGAIANVKIAPVLVIRLPNETNEIAGVWENCIVEVTSRLTELHAAVTSSGSDGLDITVGGRPEFQAELLSSINNVFSATGGECVTVNGKPILAIGEGNWTAESGPPPSLFIRSLLKWKNDLEDFAAQRAQLTLAPNDAGVSRLTAADREGVVAFYSNGDQVVKDELCTVSGTTDASVIENGLVGSQIANVLQSGIHNFSVVAQHSHGSIFTVWTRDQRLVAFADVMKAVAIAKCDATEWHLGLECILMFQTNVDLDDYAAANLIARSVGSQLEADIETLSKSALRNTTAVTIDVLVWAMGKCGEDQEAVDLILDDIEDLLEEISVDPPIGTAIGKIVVRKMDRAMARQSMAMHYLPSD